MCIHPEIIKTQDGWYCPDCKQMFDKRPTEKITILNVEDAKEVKEEKPKAKKTNSKSTAKK